MTNAELIKALRYCAEHEGCDYYIAKDCPRESTWVCGADCEQILMIDAADALEADEQLIAEQQKQIAKLYILLNNRINEIAELEARLPKEAHWVAIHNGMGVCSNCNRQDRIDNLATHCRYCGAKMRTVTDCHTLEER